MGEAKLKHTQPSAAMEQFRQELALLCGRHMQANTAQALLAVAAYAVGQLVAMQDQRVTTAEGAMQLVSANIQQGNQDAIARLLATEGSA